MKIAVDTNVLVRAVVGDDAAQSRAATTILRKADLIAVALPALCEFVWVLRRVYKFEVPDVASAIRVLLATRNVEMNRPAVELGLSILESGGDFADGVIAYEGMWLGADSFASFDKNAVSLLNAQGIRTRPM